MKTLLKKSPLKLFLLINLTLLLVSCGEKTKKEETEIVAEEPQQTENFGGLALYTLRDAMTENAEQTLETVVEDGYLNIEAAGYADGKFYNSRVDKDISVQTSHTTVRKSLPLHGCYYSTSGITP